MRKDTKHLVSSLTSPEEASKYLNIALDFCAEAEFLFALRNVVIAQGGFTALAEKTGLTREGLYKSLTPHSNPRFSTIFVIIHALGFDFSFAPAVGILKEKKLSLARRNSLAATHPEIAREWFSAKNAHSELAKEWHPTRNGDLTPNDVTAGSKKKVFWKCSKCGDHEWAAIVADRVRGGSCPYCAVSKKKHE